MSSDENVQRIREVTDCLPRVETEKLLVNILKSSRNLKRKTLQKNFDFEDEPVQTISNENFIGDETNYY